MFTFQKTALISFLGVTLLTSCSSRWSEKQKAALGSISLTPATVSDKAYQNPRVKPPLIESGESEGVGGPLDLIFIGMWSWNALQQAGLNADNKRFYPELQRHAPLDIAAELDGRLSAALRSDPFVGPRLAEDSPNRFTARILKYWLEQDGRDEDGNRLVRARVEVKINLRYSYDDEFLGLEGTMHRWLVRETIVGTSEHQHPVSAFAADGQLLRNAFGEALDSVVTQLTATLDQGLGR